MRNYGGGQQAGHRCGKNREFRRYSVWNNRTDELIAVDKTARECAKAMGIRLVSFFTMLSRKSPKWHIEGRWADEEERNED